KYPIRLEYYEEGGEAVANLAWSNSIQNRETIPSTQLFPEPSFDFPGRYQVKLFPSPAADLLTLEIQVKTNSEDLVNYHIYDVQGRMLGRGELSVTSSITTTELDVSNYAPGVYIIDLEGDKFISEVIKFIKR
ncbi:MAG: T9SS type A sorting domain-containing protein, partial [Bacteroidota bacterium]